MPDLGEAVVRARGLSGHLLSREELSRLTRSTTTGVLAGALQVSGYWPPPSAQPLLGSAVEELDSTIEHECARRLGLLGRWLGARRGAFAAVFEDEERRALRIRLRRARGRSEQRIGAELWALPRSLRRRLEAAGDAEGLVAALSRAGSPYAEPLRRALESGGSPMALERALDRTFAARSLLAARQLGGHLQEWVEDSIDCESAWGALLGDEEGFLEGGRHLNRDRYASIAREMDERARRHRLSKVFAGNAIAAAFVDPDAPLASLESRVSRARIAAERRAARREPLGPAPILEFALRLAAERADLRCINWGIAQGLPAPAIAEQLVAAA